MSGFWWGPIMNSNHEDEYYDPLACSAAPGYARLKAEYLPQGQRHYRSGAITTFKSFSQTYGRFEVRCRMPQGRGLWPAFWLLPVSKAWPPEIDGMELLGHEPNKVYMTNHYITSSQPNASQQAVYSGPDFSADFHTFGVDWQPGLIIWTIDGIERGRSTQGVPAEPMYLLLNLAVGGVGSWPGPPEASTVFPAYLDIDYVRVYRAN